MPMTVEYRNGVQSSTIPYSNMVIPEGITKQRRDSPREDINEKALLEEHNHTKALPAKRCRHKRLSPQEDTKDTVRGKIPTQKVPLKERYQHKMALPAERYQHKKAQPE